MNFTNLISGNRLKSGFIFGIIGTFFMTLIMLTGMITGISPIPEPIPAAIIKSILGTLPKPALMILAMVSHFIYGGVAGIILFKVSKKHRPILQGLAWGIILWLIMHLLILPLIGWGFFARIMNPKIIPATLILHLIYGFVLGFGLRKYSSKSRNISH